MARIEDYAMIGDSETAALVGRDGSIDWLCWPNFASTSCFAKLLGSDENGFWKIAPDERILQTGRRYEEHTLILETTIETKKGVVQILDFMPPRGEYSQLVRVVKGLRGKVKMRSELALRFNYGAAIPWVMHIDDGIRAEAGPDSVVLRSAVKMHGDHMRSIGEFTVSTGDSVSFVLTHGSYGNFHHDLPEPIDVDEAYNSAKQYWTEWAGQSTYEGQHHEMIERSLITLKALTYRPTGAIVAAPTTSMPEDIGGVRNWDYRYCWLRDTTFTLLALMNGGYYGAAADWLEWLRRAVAGSPAQAQIMYGIAGERTLVEWDVDWLPGYENSAPVRIGNAAHKQLQLDIYGETLDAFYQAYGNLGEHHKIDFPLLTALVNHLETIWELPDDGIWETRGGRQHFVYSKVMAWVAFDRAVKLAEKAKFDAPVARWKKTRDAIHKQVCKKGFSKSRNSFVQHYGTRQLDASVLLIPMVGFLPPTDPRVKSTVEAIERHLTEDGLVMRYNPAKSPDGLPGKEGVFLACSFWMVSNLKFIGRDADALALFNRVVGLANDVGLLSEEYDVKRKRLVGNFPQAFSHIALLGAAYHLFGTARHARHNATEGQTSNRC